MEDSKRQDRQSCRPLLILTYPRTTSNLFMRMLSIPNQSDAVSVESGGYFFLPAFQKIKTMKLLDRPSSQWTDEEWKSLEEVYSSCTDDLQALLRNANKTGRKPVFKEHTPFVISPSIQASSIHEKEAPENPWRLDLGNMNSTGGFVPDLPHNQSVFPAGFLLDCTPAFLIRHPALAFPSYYRMIQKFRGDNGPPDLEQPIFKHVFTLQWTRNLFDWFLAVNKKSPNFQTAQSIPIILDADDILTNPKIVLHFCDLVGLDSSKVQFEWDCVAKEDLGKEDSMRQNARSTLLSSTGIASGKTFQGLTIEGEFEKWKMEFGNVVAERLHSFVKAATLDYEYLTEKRLQLRS